MRTNRRPRRRQVRATAPGSRPSRCSPLPSYACLRFVHDTNALSAFRGPRPHRVHRCFSPQASLELGERSLRWTVADGAEPAARAARSRGRVRRARSRLAAAAAGVSRLHEGSGGVRRAKGRGRASADGRSEAHWQGVLKAQTARQVCPPASSLPGSQLHAGHLPHNRCNAQWAMTIITQLLSKRSVTLYQPRCGHQSARSRCVRNRCRRCKPCAVHPMTPTLSPQVMHSEEEWARMLTPAQYAVLRQANTERSFSSPLYTVRFRPHRYEQCCVCGDTRAR